MTTIKRTVTVAFTFVISREEEKEVDEVQASLLESPARGGCVAEINFPDVRWNGEPGKIIDIKAK